MPVPKKKTSKTKTATRRSHNALSVNLSTCAQCKEIVPSHTVCPNCGYYAGKQAKEVKTK